MNRRTRFVSPLLPFILTVLMAVPAWAVTRVKITTPVATDGPFSPGAQTHVGGWTDWDYFSGDSYVYHVKIKIKDNNNVTVSYTEGSTTVGLTSGTFSWDGALASFPGTCMIIADGFDWDWNFVATDVVGVQIRWPGMP